MKLCHFTAVHLLDGCKRDGLTLGRVPWSDGRTVELRPGLQWLTTNPKWEQSWHNPEFSSLPYSRTAVRITVSIPPIYRKRVLKWLRYCKGNKLTRDLNSYGDPENWRIFRGAIPPEWFTAIEVRPS